MVRHYYRAIMQELEEDLYSIDGIRYHSVGPYAF
jgi:hypothetical protein